MPIAPRVLIARSVGAALLFLVLISGCAATPPDLPEGSGVESSVPTVTVESRDITSVVVVDGSVVASPSVVVYASAEGKVSYVASAVDAPYLDAGTVVARVGGIDVTIPFAGRVQSTAYPSGAKVPAYAALANVSYAGFAVMALIPSVQLFRLYTQPSVATAAITGGPGGISCSLYPTDSPPDPETGAVSVVCILPSDAAVVAGLPAKLGIETARREGVLAIPVTAVLGSVDQGVVTVVRGDERIETQIELGVSDGSYVEVLAGLEEGDRILDHAPGLQ